MKVDLNRIKKLNGSQISNNSTDLSNECSELIHLLVSCERTHLADELSKVRQWTYGKCELYHWIEILNRFDDILQEACQTARHPIAIKLQKLGEENYEFSFDTESTILDESLETDFILNCDCKFKSEDKKLLLALLDFTKILIEHSFSRHLYNSIEHLIKLLQSRDTEIVLSCLDLLYMFSKRSNFISRLNAVRKQQLIKRLSFIAEKWSGNEYGLTLLSYLSLDYKPGTFQCEFNLKLINFINLQSIIEENKHPAEIMEIICQQFGLNTEDEKINLYIRLRLAFSFSSKNERKQFIIAKLQSLSILIYSNALDENISSILYGGFLEELVKLIEDNIVNDHNLDNNIIDIRAAALRTLTAIIHLDRNPNMPRRNGNRLNTIVDVTGAAFYHGFLPNLVRSCITQLIATVSRRQQPTSLATALFSFLYHLASYESGAEALVQCGIMESLLQVIRWSIYSNEPLDTTDIPWNITFVTRAVRVIDLITNNETTAFRNHGGLTAFIERLAIEIEICRKEIMSVAQGSTSACLPQRSALLKSILNFMKNAIQEMSFTDNIRHLMEGLLPSTLQHIVQHSVFYGASLFLLAIDVITVYIFQEPTCLSALQDIGLTGVLLDALIVNDIPPTREVIGSLPNVFSALCLNERGLKIFIKFRPFEKLSKMILSPLYLTAMRRRRSGEPVGDTATNLGSGIDELMRHQPTLKSDVIISVVKLLTEIIDLGTNEKYMCWRPGGGNSTATIIHHSTISPTDEDDDVDEDASTSSTDATAASTNGGQSESVPAHIRERLQIPLVEYIVNAMKYIDGILANNSTDDHCNEFIQKRGVHHLIKLLILPNLPVDTPMTSSAHSVATVCKSILNLTHNSVTIKLLIEQLTNVTGSLKKLTGSHLSSRRDNGSVLLEELITAGNLTNAFQDYNLTPILHNINNANGCVLTLVHICRTGKLNIREMTIRLWSEQSSKNLLRELVELYTALVWESTLLLALCTDENSSRSITTTLNTTVKADDNHTSESATDIDLGDDNAMDIDFLNSTSCDTMLLNFLYQINIDLNSETTQITSSATISRFLQLRKLKLIKTLLGASSRLGRSLAELFGLLIKLCVGYPLRQKRGQHITSISQLNQLQCNIDEISRILCYVIVDGCRPNEMPLAKPQRRLRLTYLICSLGFASSMLFDDKQMAYQLMISQFCSAGGLNTFFTMFEWALTDGGRKPLCYVTSDPEHNFTDGVCEFLDAWLQLLEKLLNPVAIIEAVIYTTNTSRPKFDPYIYLINVNDSALHALQKLWNFKCISFLGQRITDTIISILKLIYSSDKLIRDEFDKRSSLHENRHMKNSKYNNTNIFPNYIVNQEQLKHLMDMGFSYERCIDALLHTLDLEQATEYILLHASNAASGPSTSSVNLSTTPVAMDWDEDLNNKTDSGFKFMKPTSLSFMKDIAYDLLFRMIDFIFDFNGDYFRSLISLFNVLIVNCTLQPIGILTKLLDYFNEDLNILQGLLELLTITFDIEEFKTFINGNSAKRFRIHLEILTILIDNRMVNKIILEESNVRKLLKELLNFFFISSKFLTSNETSIPKELPIIWLPSLLNLIDVYEKNIVSIYVRHQMEKLTNWKWKWFDITNGRWLDYIAADNDTINAAYKKGETTCRLIHGRQKYTIDFNCMSQVNDETRNHRPICLTLKSMNQFFKRNASINQHSTSKSNIKLRKQLVAGGYQSTELEELIKTTIQLLKSPIVTDARTITYLLRLCIRITRQHRYAELFLQFDGIKLLLQPLKKFEFNSFYLLASILIRHVIEDRSILQSSMEQIISDKISTSTPVAYREMLFLFRQCSSAITREPTLFVAAATKILQLDANELSKDIISKTRRIILSTIKNPISNTERNIIIKNFPFCIQSVFQQLLEGLLNKLSPSQKNDQIFTSINILKTLGDLCRCYPQLGQLIVDYVYQPNNGKDDNRIKILKPTTALEFIFDNLLPCENNIQDHNTQLGNNNLESDCIENFIESAIQMNKRTSAVRSLIVSLSNCNEDRLHPKFSAPLHMHIKYKIVIEIKYAIRRCLARLQNNETCKNDIFQNLQILIKLIQVLVDQTTNENNLLRVSNNQRNSSHNITSKKCSMFYLMIQENYIEELIKIFQYIELISGQTINTINMSLKTIDMLLRILHQFTQLNNVSSTDSQSTNIHTDDQNQLISYGSDVPIWGLMIAIPDKVDGNMQNNLIHTYPNVTNSDDDGSSSSSISTFHDREMDEEEYIEASSDESSIFVEEVSSIHPNIIEDGTEVETEDDDDDDDDDDDSPGDDDGDDDDDENDEDVIEDTSDEERNHANDETISNSQLHQQSSGRISFPVSLTVSNETIVPARSTNVPNQRNFDIQIRQPRVVISMSSCWPPTANSRQSNRLNSDTSNAVSASYDTDLYLTAITERHNIMNHNDILQRLLGSNSNQIPSYSNQSSQSSTVAFLPMRRTILDESNHSSGSIDIRDFSNILQRQRINNTAANSAVSNDDTGFDIFDSFSLNQTNFIINRNIIHNNLLQMWIDETKLIGNSPLIEFCLIAANYFFPYLKKLKSIYDNSIRLKKTTNNNRTQVESETSTLPSVSPPLNPISPSILTSSSTNIPNSTLETDVFGDSSTSLVQEIEIPEGLDASFLAALPENIRQEVIDDHNRMQRCVAAASTAASISSSDASRVHEVNPEFLAALPPNIQEEVLAQQRIEQERANAVIRNPNDPVDAAELFQNMPSILRQSILTDIEDSQISALPPDLAAEAHLLRREVETRNRSSTTHLNRTIPILFNDTDVNGTSTDTRNISLRYGIRNNSAANIESTARSRNFSTVFSLQSNSNIGNFGSTNVVIERHGRPLLRYTEITTLLLFLFIDDSKFNTFRLHRIIRNLCYHVPSREWIIQSLIDILSRAVIPESSAQFITHSTAKYPKWLNLRVETTFALKSNLFQLTAEGKLIINGPAAQMQIIKNSLDLLVILARTFPQNFYQQNRNNFNKDAQNFPSVSNIKSELYNNSFWELLFTMDSQFHSRQSELIANLDNWDAIGKPVYIINKQSVGIPAIKINYDEKNELERQLMLQKLFKQNHIDRMNCFRLSPFGTLLELLAEQIFSTNQSLMDKLLRLLSSISICIPDDATHLNDNQLPEAERHLQHVIGILETRSCTEDRLDDGVSLILNLCQLSRETCDVIVDQLLKNAIRLAEDIQNLIQNLKESITQWEESLNKGASCSQPQTSKANNILNRYTQETIIIQSKGNVKPQISDLKLNAFSDLISKQSPQLYFLRIMKVLIQIRELIKSSIIMKHASSDDRLYRLSETLNVSILWNTLSDCLLKLEKTEDPYAVLVLQPTVEGFFLVHSATSQYFQQRENQIKGNITQIKKLDSNIGYQHEQPKKDEFFETAVPSPTMLEEFEEELSQSDGRLFYEQMLCDRKKFLQFAKLHRTVLNQILRQTNEHLSDGPFNVLMKHTQLLDFDIKRKYFRTELERLDDGIRREEIAVHVHRTNVFQESFQELFRRNSDDWKNRFYIVFEDEEGQDAGGLLREWYMIISREIFNPMYALFTVSPGDRVTYMINPLSHINPNHLSYYKFVGRVIAKAIYDNKLLDCYFTRSLYKHILGIPVRYTDMASEDYEFYKGLVYLMEHPIQDMGTELTFCLEVQEFGVTTIRDLISNGRNIPVTEENKLEYIRLVCQLKMSGSIRQQLDAFLDGFYDLIPQRLISIFNEQELELLISGLPTIDIDDLKQNTEYHKYHINSIQIKWFWRALRSFEQSDRANFLQFVTGTSKVPLQGFSSLEGMNGIQKFQIHRDDRSTDRLPCAHTCFNQLDLPVYETYDKLKMSLLKAIHECSEGFGFA